MHRLRIYRLEKKFYSFVFKVKKKLKSGYVKQSFIFPYTCQNDKKAPHLAQFPAITTTILRTFRTTPGFSRSSFAIIWSSIFRDITWPLNTNNSKDDLSLEISNSGWEWEEITLNFNYVSSHRPTWPSGSRAQKYTTYTPRYFERWFLPVDLETIIV